MSEAKAERICSAEGCGKKLHGNNKGDACRGCITGERTAPKPAKAARTVVAPRREGDGLERFKVVATALGYEPDELMASFAAAWLEQLREKVGAE